MTSSILGTLLNRRNWVTSFDPLMIDEFRGQLLVKMCRKFAFLKVKIVHLLDKSFLNVKMYQHFGYKVEIVSFVVLFP